MKLWQQIILVLFCIAGIIGIHLLPQSTVLELKGMDLFNNGHPAHPDIVIVAIDSKSLNAIGRWPWPRSVHAELINKLNEVNPTSVASDVLFANTEDPKDDLQLTQALAAAKYPVVLAAEAVYTQNASSPQSITLPLLQFMGSSTVIGHANISLSSDGVARYFPEYLQIGSTTYTPFAYQVAKDLGAKVPTDNRHLVNYAGAAGSFPTVSAVDVLQGKVPQEKLAHKIILIGATASDLHDTVLTPNLQPLMAGIEWHANVITNILLQDSKQVVPLYLPIAIGLFILLLFSLLVGRLSAHVIYFSLIGVIIALPLLSFIFWQMGFALPYLLNLLLTATLFVWHSLYRWYKAENERRKLRRTFRNYFSPQVLEAIVRNPNLLSLGGDSRRMTILFSDIRSFTTISESLPPEQLTAILQEYFTEMTEEVLATDGVIDKFIGDAIMAFWGAPIDQPDQADRAVTAALGMIWRLEKLQDKWKSQGYPEIRIGVGINTGQVTVGNMGSQTRFDYTVIGDTVNSASRLEGLNKEYKTSIIISESTKEALKINVELRNLGGVKVKGKTKELTIYEVKGFSKNP